MEANKYEQLIALLAKLGANTHLERLRILTMMWMVRDICGKENWDYPHAVLDHRPEIEAELGRFPGHNEVGKKGAAEWKSNFSAIYELLKGANLPDLVNDILGRENANTSFITIDNIFMPIAKSGESNTLRALYRILFVEQQSPTNHGKYAQLKENPPFGLTSADADNLLEWYFPAPFYNRICIIASLRVLISRIVADSKMTETSAVLLLFVWVSMCVEVIDKHAREYPAEVLLKNATLRETYRKPIAFAQKVLNTKPSWSSVAKTAE